MTDRLMQFDLEHITARTNRDGTTRYYFRRRGQPLERLPGEPLSAEFMAAYRRCLEWVAPSVHASHGSFAWLCDLYMNSTEFRTKAPATRAARRRIILTMLREPLVRGKPETFGQEMVRFITRRHIEVLRDRKAEAPNAANERLKILSRVFHYAVRQDLAEVNPVRDVERVRAATEGHATATDEQLAAYLARHTSGPARLAMVILMNTGVRISDLRVLGRQHVRNGHLIFRTTKTGVLCELPISAELAAALPADDMTFLKSDHGQPFRSDKSLSQRVGKWFRQSGVEGVTAHSVRKWLATRMAENGATEYQLMAWFGWNDPKEARPYIRAANRRRLATEASTMMSRV